MEYEMRKDKNNWQSYRNMKWEKTQMIGRATDIPGKGGNIPRCGHPSRDKRISTTDGSSVEGPEKSYHLQKYGFCECLEMELVLSR